MDKVKQGCLIWGYGFWETIKLANVFCLNDTLVSLDLIDMIQCQVY